MNKYVKAGVDSAKTAGFVLGGFIGGNAVSKAIKKDNWKINLVLFIASLAANGFLKNKMAKDAAIGASVYFGTKTLNNLTAEVVNGLEGVPQGVKDAINKVVPRLNGADDDDLAGELSAAETQLLAQYYNHAGRPWDKQIAPMSASGSNLFGLGSASVI